MLITPPMRKSTVPLRVCVCCHSVHCDRSQNRLPNSNRWICTCMLSNTLSDSPRATRGRPRASKPHTNNPAYQLALLRMRISPSNCTSVHGGLGMYIILISIAIVCLRQPLTTTVPIRFPLTPALSHLHKAGGLHKECSSGTGATML